MDTILAQNVSFFNSFQSTFKLFPFVKNLVGYFLAIYTIRVIGIIFKFATFCIQIGQNFEPHGETEDRLDFASKVWLKFLTNLDA